jgi:hypothetical protein
MHGRVVIISVRTAATRTDTVAITVLVEAGKATFAETRLGIGRDCKHHEGKNSVHGRVTLSTPENDPVK